MPFLHIRDLLVALSTATFVHRKHPKTLHLRREMTKEFFNHLQKFDPGAYVSCEKWAFVVAVLLHLSRQPAAAREQCKRQRQRRETHPNGPREWMSANRWTIHLDLSYYDVQKDTARPNTCRTVNQSPSDARLVGGLQRH